MKKIAYLGMDVHARNCVLGNMDDSGTFLGNLDFRTSENNIINALDSIKAKEKYLALEEGTLAHWAAQVASPYVSQVIICDPRENALIYKSPHKRDPVDTRKLCRLLRLGELKQVYHPQDDARAIFKAAVQHYHDLSHQLARFKLKIKAMYRYIWRFGLQYQTARTVSATSPAPVNSPTTQPALSSGGSKHGHETIG